jgi:hypothetical protein
VSLASNPVIELQVQARGAVAPDRVLHVRRGSPGAERRPPRAGVSQGAGPCRRALDSFGLGGGCAGGRRGVSMALRVITTYRRQAISGPFGVRAVVEPDIVAGLL